MAELWPAAAGAGCLPTLEYLIKRGMINCRRLCAAVLAAAECGRMDALEFLMKRFPSVNGSFVDHWHVVPMWLDMMVIMDGPSSFADAVPAAAANGHLHILEYLLRHGCPSGGAQVCTEAARHGHVHVVQFCHFNGMPFTHDAMVAAAGNAQMAVLEFGVSAGIDPTEQAVSAAALQGHLAVLKWAFALGYEPTEDNLLSAARGGHTAVMEALLAHPQPPQWTSGLVSQNAEYGDFVPVVGRWAIERDLPFMRPGYMLWHGYGDLLELWIERHPGWRPCDHIASSDIVRAIMMDNQDLLLDLMRRKFIRLENSGWLVVSFLF